MSFEALCYRNLYFLHRFPGRCGTNNDITSVDKIPLFMDTCPASVVLLYQRAIFWWCRTIGLLYYLFYVNYPWWAIFFGPSHWEVNELNWNMTRLQEAIWKDIERLFGALQCRFRILRHESFGLINERIILISQFCVILHKMIV